MFYSPLQILLLFVLMPQRMFSFLLVTVTNQKNVNQWAMEACGIISVK